MPLPSSAPSCALAGMKDPLTIAINSNEFHQQCIVLMPQQLFDMDEEAACSHQDVQARENRYG